MPNSITGSNLVGNLELRGGSTSFRAHDPAARKEIEPPFFVARPDEVSEACRLAAAANKEFGRSSSRSRAALLRSIALEIEKVAAEAVERAHQETALPLPRLQGEIGRTTGQLRIFANLLDEGSWVDARIDHADPDRKPAAKPDLRRMLIPIGPIAVFGASNFPFAFSVAGGDTSSALAAGCPVVVKAHPAHPGTSEIIGRAVAKAIQLENLDPGVFSLVQGSSEVGQLVAVDPNIEAIAFTGSFRGGSALLKTAATRPKPIPVFAEMGSINPVVIHPSSIEDSASREKISSAYSASLTLGVGQFCTNPGLIVGIGGDFEKLIDEVSAKLKSIPAGVMLTSTIAENHEKLAGHLATQLGSNYESGSDGCGKGNIFRVSGAQFLNTPELSEEIFGPTAVAVTCASVSELQTVLRNVPGQLTATLQFSGETTTEIAEIFQLLQVIAGRVIINGYPTGVEVSPSMQHGGPFPATSDSRSTSVGTAAIYRFVRPIAFQDTPESLLPDELKEANPLKIRRLVDGDLVV